MQHLCPLACWLALAGAAAAQATMPRPSSKDDPYSQEPEVRNRAGIVAVGRFVWADHHTPDIQSLMGYEPFRFLETEHFKLACSLSPIALPTDRDARSRLLAEIATLRKALPAVPESPDDLDAWLRVHLFARRLEELRSSYVSHFGAFAPAGHKTLVMLCRSGASVGTYARNYLDLKSPRRTLRARLTTGDDLLATAEQMPDEDLSDDARLHAAVACHVTRLWLARACGGAERVPPWLDEGLGQWFSSRMAPAIDYFATPPPELPETPHQPSWTANVRARVDAGWQPQARLLFAQGDAAALRFVDRLEAWARVDHLIRAHKTALPLLLRMVRESDGDHAARFTIALDRVLGIEPAQLDAQWQRFVVAHYGKD